MDNSTHDESSPPVTTSTSLPGELSSGTFTNEDVSMIPRPSPVHFVLGNFFLAMLLISLIIFTIFVTVTWFTVLQDTGSMEDWVLSNVTGVSICLHRYERISLTTTAEVGISPRPWSSTGSRYAHVVHFMAGCHLRCKHHFQGPVVGGSRTRPVRTV